MFSSHMSWNNHVTYIHKNLCRVAGIMNKYRHILPVNIKRLIYNSLFHSVICYSHLVWGTTTKSNLEKLRLLQKKAVRIIENVPQDHHSLPLFEKHKIIDIYNMYSSRLILNYQQCVRKNINIILDLAKLEKKLVHLPITSRPPGVFLHLEQISALRNTATNYRSC